jgi:DNA-binding beta-propeller fold protein YncE
LPDHSDSRFSSLRWLAIFVIVGGGALLITPRFEQGQDASPRAVVNLPTSKMLLNPIPGQPQPTNSFPTAAVISPNGRYLALLNNGRGTAESGYQQSISVLDLETNRLSDYPDPRLKVDARQTFFLGLAFSSGGKRLYASFASLTDPTGKRNGDTGNGIAVYDFSGGVVTPQTFFKIPLQPLAPGKKPPHRDARVPLGEAVPYPAGLAVVERGGQEDILVANNLADNVLLLNAANGAILQRFDLSTESFVPAAYPYAVVATRDGNRAYCSLWNASQVVELDLERGKVARRTSLLAPDSPTAAGSHPTALLLSPDERRLYVALANRDAVAVIDTTQGKLTGKLSTLLPGQKHAGTYPNALAQTADGKRLFVADASLDAVAVFEISALPSPDPIGFIPTEWYPTALAVRNDELFVASGKGQGTGPNAGPAQKGSPDDTSGEERQKHPYIVSLIRGSVARMNIAATERRLSDLTGEALKSNLFRGQGDTIPFQGASNPIKHVIYIIKENRTYDQILGDLKPGDGDPALCMYGESITPNQHQLARQFGIVDNFYDSGEVSGDGHVWSTAAITSDYTEKTWQIGYRSQEHTYDYEGGVANGSPMEEGISDVNEPSSGYIWTNVERHGMTHRNYGEFVGTDWCDSLWNDAPSEKPCKQAFVRPGELLPANVGEPHGSRSQWPWLIPMMVRDVALKPELKDHFDPHYPDFRIEYPDQLRVDEFLNEFGTFVKAREQHQGTELPQFVILRLGNDHTLGTQPKMPTPEASVADNDLAVGRVAEEVSHSPYWDDTAIFVLEDDAQDGGDHVDAHRSTALVISKYAPGSPDHPFVDHNFYTTVNMVHTMETLLGLPPMNQNDAQAAAMAPLFTGAGNQAPFQADRTNLRSGALYQVNRPNAPGAKESSRLDFSHADAADPAKLNAILWRQSKGDIPAPVPRHAVFAESQ